MVTSLMLKFPNINDVHCHNFSNTNQYIANT